MEMSNQPSTHLEIEMSGLKFGYKTASFKRKARHPKKNSPIFPGFQFQDYILGLGSCHQGLLGDDEQPASRLIRAGH